MTSTYSHFLNGQAVASDSDQHSDVFNPATGEVIAQVPMATQAELAQAVAHAKDAAAVWGDMPSARRARVMFKLLELLNANIDRMAEVVTREHGKTFDDAKGEVMRGIEIVEFATGICTPKPTVQRQRGKWRRPVPAAPATGRHRRHYAV